ncbi:beta-lactamase hydrolase domain-containing protein [Telmatospirillum sp.]|uniref:beta-lactamase hydrolase domain-containing protein n=1 Tax=Telmatospirillum sp. TaxID=2079197 RepID=UPI002847640E|nr:sulfur transferase domain-containing protein [Telmatospirillum sp.]MDR3440028.1 sulfur transferase domain-containing protein [Telmatospirillum sp.]
MKRGKLTDKIEVAGQPTAEEVKGLKAEGFTTVVNMRRDGEADQPLSPAEEGRAAQAAGLDYHHIPVDPNDLQPEQAAALKKVLEEAKGPVFLHCAGGPRATAVALVALGVRDKEAALATAAKAGFPITNPNQIAFIERETGKGRQ